MAINFVTNNDVRTMKDLERSGNFCETKRHVRDVGFVYRCREIH